MGSSGAGQNANKTKHRKDLTFLPFTRSSFCTPCCTLRCFIFNRNLGVMAGLATSASISSFITWSTCSGHRSLNGLRSLTTYTAARRTNLPNRRVLDRAAAVTGPFQISRVCFISRASFGPTDTAPHLLETSDTSMLQHHSQCLRTRIKCLASRRMRLQPK